MAFQNNNSNWLNGSDDDDDEVLDTVYLIMEDRIKEWKHDLKNGSRFRFYRFILQSMTDVYFIMQKKIKEWEYERIKHGSRRRFYSNILHFSVKIEAQQKKRKEKEEEKNWHFKSMLKDGWTNELIVKYFYREKIEKIRLEARLKELNIKSYEISTQRYSDLNKHGNLYSVFYKGTEIIY
jgi:hypothetical protein